MHLLHLAILPDCSDVSCAPLLRLYLHLMHLQQLLNW
jgi:hypothetical protein